MCLKLVETAKRRQSFRRRSFVLTVELIKTLSSELRESSLGDYHRQAFLIFLSGPLERKL